MEENNQISKAHSIIGVSNGREVNDFYPTPAYATELLLKFEKFDGNIFEPACGEGDISEVLIKHGYDVYSSDLIDRNYGDVGIDFLKYNGKKHNNIITNPPYKHALDFVLKSKEISNKKIAMFLKTVFLESDTRYNMFQDKEFPLKGIYQFSKRVTLSRGGVKMKNSGMISYAWFVWDKDWIGEPIIRWIK